MNLLARREHTVWELQCKLSKKSQDSALITEVIHVLADEGLQSDARFAEAYLRMRAKRGFGPERIQLELEERKVAPHLIERAFQNNDICWQTEIKSVWQKRFGDEIPTDFIEKAKQKRFLQYRGFSIGQINTLLE